MLETAILPKTPNQCTIRIPFKLVSEPLREIQQSHFCAFAANAPQSSPSGERRPRLHHPSPASSSVQTLSLRTPKQFIPITRKRLQTTLIRFDSLGLSRIHLDSLERVAAFETKFHSSLPPHERPQK
jgi:hypothetical protein